VHHGGEALQAAHPAPASARRWPAAAALITLLIGPGLAPADEVVPANPEPGAEGSVRPEQGPEGATSRGGPLVLSGYVQADLIPWDQRSADELDDTGAPLNQERALIRRARLRADVTHGRTFAQLELDGNTVAGPTARLVGAKIGLRHADAARDVEASLALGLFKIPFGREVPAPEAARDVLEPTTAARALFPGNYDGGVIGSARWRALELTVAFTNGAPAGDAQFHGRDPSASWDLVGRAGARGELTYGVTLGGGVSALTGQGLHAGTAAIKETLTWVDMNEDGLVQTTELVVIPGAPATPSVRFDRSAVGADLELGWCLCALGKGRLTLEGVLATNLDRGLEYADPTAADRDLRELGWHVQVVQEVTRHAQVAARWESYRPDRDAFEIRGEHVVPTDPRYRVITVAAEAHRANARFIVEYDHDTNPRGRGLDGAPATLASDRVTARAQVSF